MIESSQPIPPWEGPDLLADAKAAARKAGETAGARAKPISRAVRAKPRELTWADFEVNDQPTTAKPVASSSLPSALLEKYRQKNALTSAAAQAEREATGKGKPARRPRTSCDGANGRRPGSGGFRTSILTSDQVLEIWNSHETGVALAKRFGVSSMAISSIRTGKAWGHLTATLGKPGVAPRKRKGAADGKGDCEAC